ncbi:Gfo/Idh/MocA family oxidoreductase [Couchioplanes caeruleus]|uniref:Gfo/Idh/MocA-like oxidoreductase N-terminal domain-containing protein n=2 Tax=Couchioplanes caeruleus TaxID=56438 RepID=A0A1K0FHT6_9ACTN|nr:Gfo/Idh/MocA family oxidoreductase [Couchioplanes caeruleus]OJF12397.1 hypothetical protein BG844_20755 [Couchioplanes caeruleus subsp. caeruleus]ROP29499.1 putative dehydrogenase [Couchioplanes caeruleus]
MRDGRRRTPTRICVVGYGAAGRLHTSLLDGPTVRLLLVDPATVHPDATLPTWRSVAELPDEIVADIDVWSVCSPTATHLTVLREILARDPRARIVLEKPACTSSEIDDFQRLLAGAPGMRLAVTDQYRRSRAATILGRLVRTALPADVPRAVQVVFAKDRVADVRRGRFVDLDYGVLGYEWLHMLAVLGHLLPPAVTSTYLCGPVGLSTLQADRDESLFVSALHERTALPHGGRLELYSSVTGIALPWETRGDRPPTGAANRLRFARVTAGDVELIAEFDPVGTADGRTLGRNRHRISVRRDGRWSERVIEDSPLRTGLHEAVRGLLDGPPPAVDLLPLRRIARLAAALRADGPAPAGRPARMPAGAVSG